MNKAIFLDKDGTVIIDIPYNVNANLISLSDNTAQGLRLLQHQGFLLVIITNQAGVALGYFEEDALTAVGDKLAALFIEERITLNGFYYCPHHPQGTVYPYNINCNCRKPQTGMLLQAANDLNIDLRCSWMIGDILNDVEAGNRAGCKSILIDNGNETEWVMNECRLPLKKVANVNEAAGFIISILQHGEMAGM